MSHASPKHTKDHDEQFYVSLRIIASELDVNPEHLLAVMMSESGIMAKAHNPNGNASGLIQFMPATLRGLKWPFGHDSFRSLSASAQLPFVRKYFLPHKGKLGSIGAVYVATFLPALLANAGDPDYILTCKPNPAREDQPELTRLGWAFAPNAGFDRNRDLAITVRELEAAVARNCRGARWTEALARLRGVPSVEEPDVGEAPYDLRTTLGIQEALKALRLSPGALDGIPGPRTAAAVTAFQAAHGLVPDGIVGPLTRAELAKRLAALRPPS